MTPTAADSKPHVVILGAGFAGLAAAKILARERLSVTVIDQNNHHLFQPLLYQVATAGLSPAEIAMPIRTVLRNAPHTDVLMAKVESIDVGKRTLRLDHGGEATYDYLLLATGARHSYFNHPEWEADAPGLKVLEDATDIRRRVLSAFEEAERMDDAKGQEALLTFVIVGAGPTGIELAGAIAELAKYALAADFRHIHPELAKVILVEAGPRILGTFHEQNSAQAMKALQRLGVQIRLGSKVTNITPTGVELGSEFLPARTVLWAAGVEPSPLAKDLKVPLERGRVLVSPDLSIPGHREVFVAGDLAAVRWKESWVPGMAPGALQEGRHVAHNILRLIAGEPTASFRYHHKGSMATVGRSAAVVDVGAFRFAGFVAWVTWLVIHIFYLIGFRNRFLVMFQWAWSYFTFQRGTRLITGKRY